MNIETPPSLPPLTAETVVSDELIALVEGLRACRSALEWLRAEPRTVAEAVCRYPGWVLETTDVVRRLPPELLADCARAQPWAALSYADVVARLTPDVVARLPPETLADCARAKPWRALSLPAVVQRLPPELLADCARAEPLTALSSPAVVRRLPVDVLADCARAKPWSALSSPAVVRRLPVELLAELRAAAA